MGEDAFPWPWSLMDAGRGSDPLANPRVVGPRLRSQEGEPLAVHGSGGGETVNPLLLFGGEVPFPWLLRHFCALARNASQEADNAVSVVPQDGPVLNTEAAQLLSAGNGYPDLYLVAVGTTRTLGWKDARLIPRIHILPPADGIYEFDLIASGGSCLTAIGSVIASMALIDRPEEFKGARVFPGGVEAQL